MKKLCFVLLVLLAVPILVEAQAVPTSKFAWTQDAPTLADAQGYTYLYFPDGATTGIAFTGVTCTGATSPFACEVNIPAFTPGNHTVTLAARNVAGESAKTTPLSFVFVVTPATPQGFRIK